MKIELFQVENCKSCSDARVAFKALAEQTVPDVQWRDVDVTKEFDRAVELGVMSLPALAIDGELVFASLPTTSQLARELERRAGGGKHGS